MGPVVSSRIRVLHIVNGEFYAGAERVQDLLALRLPELGFDVGLVCLKDGVFAELRQSQAVPLYRHPMRSRVDFRGAREVANLVRREGYGLVHTHTPRAALVGQLVARLADVPMVHHVHSPSHEDTEHGWRNLRNSLVERLSLRGVRALIPVSASLAEQLLLQGYSQDRIRPVANGVPVQPLRRKRYILGEPLVLGMVALLRPRKGVEILLQAMASLRALGHDVSLRAVGAFETADYEREVMQLVEKLGLRDRVVWTGFTDDVAAQFGRMHVFVLPSLYGEGMPMVVLEAMASGLPVIGTRVEGVPQVVRDGQNGILVNPGEVTELVDAISGFVHGVSSIPRLGDSGRSRQRAEFSDIAMAENVAAVYREVLNV